MRRADFQYTLPRELIAQAPLTERSASRLLMLDGQSGAISDGRFTDLPDCLEAGDLVVFNDTRVLPARLYGRKASGGRVEILLERTTAAAEALVQIKASRAPRVGSVLELAGGARARVLARHGDLFSIELDRAVVPFFEAHGQVPLPPYIERAADSEDADRYQTVYARAPGAVAAPTAGLHFDESLLEALAARGIGIGYLTLHVGAGTFSPVRTEWIEDHRLHPERIFVSAELCARIDDTRRGGGRIVAVGTTAVRALETAAAGGRLEAYEGDSALFIYPGFEFRVVDALVTNFHLPESSLLMLVCAFAGHRHTMRAYKYAVGADYRFFSYGDAMFATRAGDGAGKPDAL
jgi:S-adenosylmethionine:tRNA ribosyltransferase-isomerase